MACRTHSRTIIGGQPSTKRTGDVHRRGANRFGVGRRFTGGGLAIAAGADCYWDATNQVATTTSTDNTLIGKCVLAAADADATVRIRIMQ